MISSSVGWNLNPGGSSSPTAWSSTSAWFITDTSDISTAPDTGLPSYLPSTPSRR
uniref:Uncharacterized protein n=1 Tax=Arundo donax TaxID=35708 RepID=A0A0A9CTN6_ARUDO